MSSEASAYSSRALSNMLEIDLPARATDVVNESPIPIDANTGRTRENSDENLLIQVSKGNKEALSVLFQRHARAVHGVARRVLKDDSEAEDLLQELFLFIFQKADLEGRVREACEKFLIDSKGVLY